jgi:hypothetical protein
MRRLGNPDTHAILRRILMQVCNVVTFRIQRPFHGFQLRTHHIFASTACIGTNVDAFMRTSTRSRLSAKHLKPMTKKEVLETKS